MQALENWYGSETDKKGVVLMVTTGKEGAVTGGASFLDVRARSGGPWAWAGLGARGRREGHPAAAGR